MPAQVSTMWWGRVSVPLARCHSACLPGFKQGIPGRVYACRGIFRGSLEGFFFSLPDMDWEGLLGVSNACINGHHAAGAKPDRHITGVQVRYLVGLVFVMFRHIHVLKKSVRFQRGRHYNPLKFFSKYFFSLFHIYIKVFL